MLSRRPTQKAILHPDETTTLDFKPQSFRFHQRVKTPYGEGLIQGWLRQIQPDGSYIQTRIIVSHPPDQKIAAENRLTTNSIPGIWTLAMYQPDQLEAA